MKKTMKKLVAMILVVALALSLIPAAMAADGYSDVASGAWYSESVQYVSDNGLMQGIGGDLFAPEDETSRAMIVTVLWRLAGEPVGPGIVFNDVDPEEWFANASFWGFGAGVVEGYPIEGVEPDYIGYQYSFRGNQPVTREELACFLYRYARYAGADVSENASLEGFADAASVSDWAAEALGWCVAEGIIQGTPEGDTLNLAPAANATRAEVAAMLMRYCERIAE